MPGDCDCSVAGLRRFSSRLQKWRRSGEESNEKVNKNNKTIDENNVKGEKIRRISRARNSRFGKKLSKFKNKYVPFSTSFPTLFNNRIAL
jgi:methionyl-tRNA synthetase